MAVCVYISWFVPQMQNEKICYFGKQPENEGENMSWYQDED